MTAPTKAASSPLTVNVPVLTLMPTRLASQPPRNAPRMPTTMSQIRPMPLPVSTLLATNPAIAPTMIQMTIPMRSLNLRGRLAAVIRTRDGELGFGDVHVVHPITEVPRVSGKPLQLRALGERIAANRRAGDEAERQHADQWPPGSRPVEPLRDAPHGGVIPLLRQGREIAHDDAGFVPRGAVAIRIRTTSPQPITA